MNVQDAAIQILKDAGKPLHAKEIAERIIEAGLWSSGGHISSFNNQKYIPPNGKNREFAEITHIGVKKSNRKNGYGSSLLEQIESVAQSQGVIVLEVETNTSTAPFYEKNGYTINSKNRFGETVHLFKRIEENTG